MAKRRILWLLVVFGVLFTSSAFGAFLDNHDGTVTDTATGLVWQKCSMGQTYDLVTGGCDGTAQGYTWEDALSICDRSTYAGHSDWRLPNRNELLSIVDYSKLEPSVDGASFPETAPAPYWSSTTYASYPDSAWCIDFGIGNPNVNYKDYRGPRVRAVRGGLSGPFYDLTVAVQGSAPARVISFPRGVSCRKGPCIGCYPQSTDVMLFVVSPFELPPLCWSGDCSSCGDEPVCVVSMDSHRMCYVVFKGERSRCR